MSYKNVKVGNGLELVGDTIQMKDTSQVHISGSTVIVASTTRNLYVNPATLIASLTITLKAAPYDGEIIDIHFGGSILQGLTVVTLTNISANTGQSLLYNSPITLAVSGARISFKYRAGNTSWYRNY